MEILAFQKEKQNQDGNIGDARFGIAINFMQFNWF